MSFAYDTEYAMEDRGNSVSGSAGRLSAQMTSCIVHRSITNASYNTTLVPSSTT